jgi:hypothetical protein
MQPQGSPLNLNHNPDHNLNPLRRLKIKSKIRIEIKKSEKTAPKNPRLHSPPNQLHHPRLPMPIPSPIRWERARGRAIVNHKTKFRFKARPHPGPLLEGEGEPSAVSPKTPRLLMPPNQPHNPRLPMPVPSPIRWERARVRVPPKPIACSHPWFHPSLMPDIQRARFQRWFQSWSERIRTFVQRTRKELEQSGKTMGAPFLKKFQ